MRQRHALRAMITLVAIGLSATSMGFVAGRPPRGGARFSAIDALDVGMGVGLLVGTIASVIVVWASRRSRAPWSVGASRVAHGSPQPSRS